MSLNKQKISRQMLVRIILLALFDAMAITLCTVFAIYVRYDFSFTDIPDYFWKSTLIFIPVNLVLTLVSFALWNLYKSVWRYASATELVNII